MDSLFKLLILVLQPLLDYANSWANTVISLMAQATFTEDVKGAKQQSGSAVIQVINRAKQPIKIQEVGIIMKDGQRVANKWLLNKDEKLPRTVEGRDNTYFSVNRDVLLKMGLDAIDAIKYVYLTDSVLDEYKSRVPKINKMQIAASLQNKFIIG